MADFITALEARGLLQDISDKPAMQKLAPGVGAYVGFDPTAPSLQVGNLVPMLVLIHLARAGVRPIMLFGGATGAIGDPSGRSEERKLLSRANLDENVKNQERKAQEIFDRAGVKVDFVNNLDWTEGLSALDFLRDIGKHFTVNYMLAKEVVKARMSNEGISFTEFSYMILQSFDFLHLHKHHNCKIQFGGSDQWGNITAGLELIRRKGQGEAFAFSVPLITDSQGKKFGKTEAGALWLDGAMTSAYQFHQFWLNIDDQDVVKYLRTFTFLPEKEIVELEAAVKGEPERRAAQRALADQVCNLVHGEGATEKAKRGAEVLFGGSLQGLSEGELAEIFRDVPSSSIARKELASKSFLDLLVTCKLVPSKGEGRRLIKNGGSYLNNERVTDSELTMSGSTVLSQGLFVLRTGKKQYHLVRVHD